MLRNKNKLLIILLIIPGLCLRLILAPYTSGSDIPQFAGFADTFLRHGLHFYDYSDASKFNIEGWPYPWPYVYGPLTIIILGLLRLVAPGKNRIWSDLNGYHVIADTGWITAVKLVLIAFDTLAAYMIYLIVKEKWGEKWALFSSLFYYYNPMVIYISSIYGMIDMIPLALFLTAIYLWRTRKSLTLTGIMIGLGASVKPSILLAGIPFALGIGLRGKARSIMVLLGFMIAIPIALMLPFMIASPHSVTVFLHGLRIIGTPNYASPIVYSFNGFSSIIYYAWEHGGTDIYKYLHYWPLPFSILYLLALFTARRDPLLSSALGYIAFTSSYWRVNHQYLVPTIGLLAIVLPGLKDECDSLLAYTTGFLVGLWPLMYPISWWGEVHIAHPNHLLIQIMNQFSFMIFDEIYYIIYGIILVVVQACLILHLSIKDATRYIRLLLLPKHRITAGTE